jgi:nitrate/nitrite transporter NarK
MPTLEASGVSGNLNMLIGVPVIAMNLCGRSADARRERRWHLVIPALACAVGFVVSSLAADNTVIAIIFLSIAACGVLTCAPLFWSLPTAFLSGTGAAAGIAVINSVGNLAGFLSPYLIGILKDYTHNNQSGMFMLAGTLVVGAIAVLRTSARMVNR